MFIGGMTDKVDIFKYDLTNDGAGGLVRGNKDYLYQNIFGRISVMDAKTQQDWFGFSGKKIWKVLLQYSGSLDNTGDYYLQLNNSSPVSVVSKGNIFRIVESRHQRNDSNVWHHTSLAIERDEQAEAV